MKSLPIIVLKRDIHFPVGCAAVLCDLDIFSGFKHQAEETTLTFTNTPTSVIVIQRAILDLLNPEESHAIFMHEQGHFESGHGSIQCDRDLSLVQEIQADEWAIVEAGVTPSVLRSALIKVLGFMCNNDTDMMASAVALFAPRLQHLV